MKNLFSANQLLIIFEAVMRRGHKTQRGQCWQGVTAYSSYDGYEVYLEADGVLLQLGFHNKYQMKYDHQSQLDEFERRMKALLQLCQKT